MTIIGILAAIAIPKYSEYRMRAKIAVVVEDYRIFTNAFRLYEIDYGQFPNDCHLSPPLPDPVLADYLDAQRWSTPTALGGRYNWEGPDGYPYAAVSIYYADGEPKPSNDVFAVIDRMLDDGDLSQGKFIMSTHERPTYIIEN